MEKVCKRCGKIAQMMSWEDYCYACLIQNELERVQFNVREAKEDEELCRFPGNIRRRRPQTNVPGM